MGTEIPLVRYDAATRAPAYAFYSTKESLDIARVSFERVKDLTIKLSAVENSAYQLAANIKKAQKRAKDVYKRQGPGTVAGRPLPV